MTFKIGIFDKYMHKVVFISKAETKHAKIYHSLGTLKISLSENYIVPRNIYII